MKDLEKMILDMIKEQQLKLGYARETVRLYIPEASLRAVVRSGQEMSDLQFETALAEFSEAVIKNLGKLKFKKLDDRYCILIPPQGSEFVHEHLQDPPFLVDLIAMFRRHDITIDNVRGLFEAYDPAYACIAQEGGEFDYLLYFNGKAPFTQDYYCVKFDHGHASYHRFNKHDIRNILEP